MCQLINEAVYFTAKAISAYDYNKKLSLPHIWFTVSEDPACENSLSWQ